MESFDIAKEQRGDRLRYVFYGIVAILALFYFFGGWSERKWNIVADVLGLTLLSYGYILYVSEIRYIRRLWLWKAVLATLPLHLLFLIGLIWWTLRFPRWAHSGFAFAYVLVGTCVIEATLMSFIIDHYRPSEDKTG